EVECPACKANIPIGRKFCGECGYALSESTEAAFPKESEHDTQIPESPPEEAIPAEFAAEGERKHVTVLFSDLTGYTAMSEKLDPEEVKEITSQIFREISKIVGQYDGFIEKYAGDAVMAIFGVPKAHEDDPIRAVKAAREIHELVNAISPDVESRIGQPISMHSGINTGLVVTGEVDMERGTHGVAGDTINLASRLSNLAKPGQILIDADTCHQAEGHFACEYLEITTVKGKSEPVQVHKVLSQRENPVSIRRLSGLRANLVGRKVEVAELADAVENLHRGKGRIFSIIGDAGTGKSRLVEDFKATLDLREIQWLEGHAYAYSQNTPYFPIIDLLNRAFHIKEGDPVESVREKLESEIKNIVDNHKDVVPYIGGLYSLSYPEVEEVSPEFWKSRLQEAISAILTGLAKRAPTVFFLEDLHWADPSFVELLRRACLEMRQPAIVLCAYRPLFSLFKSHQVSNIGKLYHEMRLQDLSRSETQKMVQSLLKTEKIPSELQRFIHEKMEGNPFYLEEAINSLIESNTLARDNDHWQVTKRISEADISPTIQGVISARVDRLEQDSKRILQEASVIGRSFYYEILKRTTALKNDIDKNLSGLERVDLIKTKSIQPDLEYIFKHVLTQEVVYTGLLKKERRKIHERIAIVIEQLFQDRLAEFYETLAFHFARGLSLNKAVSYLMKSAKKSLARYSVKDSHQYYKQAFELLDSKVNKTNAEMELVIELLIDWAYVFYYRGYFKDMFEVFRSYKMIAELLEDKTKLGMFYSWYGWALFCQNKAVDSYPYFEKALQIGEETKDQRVIGYACTWLTWYHLMTGRLDLSIKYGERTQEVSKVFKSDAYLYFKSLAGLGFAYAVSGDKKKGIEIGNALLDYGKKHSNIRSLTMGYAVLGGAYQMHNDLTTSIEAYEKAIQIGVEPFYVEFIRMNLAVVYIMTGQIIEAENALDCVVAFCEDSGAWGAGTPAQVFSGAILIAKGQMGIGLKRLKDGKQELLTSGNMFSYLQCEYILAKVFSQIAERAEPINLLKIAKNIGFIAKNVPFASKKAEGHFKKVIEVAEEMGAKVIMGSAYLDLGLLYKAKKRKDQANKYISKAIEIFERSESDVYLKQANEALGSLQ
ncbi:MAG: AAA family ATPase, partial [Deltaproteobacteria bacterium]|nr:AAA family ATPase [Deltaproteobacteria bacterium]